MKAGWIRIALAYFALMSFMLGAYAVLAPKHYFENFPVGMEWVAGDGPYNEHLMRDYGALNLALASVAICALIFATRELVVATAVSQIVYAVPHILYHIANSSLLGDSADQVGAIGGLTVNAVLGVVMLLYVFSTRDERLPEKA
jgi:hypothetical protein